MQKNDVIAYFDGCAPTWDEKNIHNDIVIGKILDNAEITSGTDVLDVACGTGVLFPYYLERGVNSVTGIDISSKMAEIAAEKFADCDCVQVICGDVESYPFERKFDRIVVYNAFPHFPKPKRLIKILARLLKEDGRLTIAHGANREAIDRCHHGSAGSISTSLMTAENLKKLFAPHFNVEIMISNKHMYQVSGVKKDPLAHSHDEDIEHTHGGLIHSHAHGDLEHEHVLDENAAPLEELLVMMKYLVSHNDAHAQEVADLARNLQGAGKINVYDEIMDAVADFDMVNAKLAAILTRMTAEDI